MSLPASTIAYTVALVATAAVAACRYGFEHRLGEATPSFLPLLIPVMAAAWIGGRGPGLAAAAINVLIVLIGVGEQAVRPDLASPADQARLGLYIGVCVFISAACERMHRTADRLKAETMRADARHQELRKQSADRQTADRRFQLLLESVPQLIWTCLPDGRCDYLSRQWIEYTGAPEAEQLDYGWLNAVHPDDRPHLMARWNSAVATGSPFDVEFRLRHKSGEYRWFKTRAVLALQGDGSAKWFGTNTDIHDRRKMEERLREFNATLERQVAERTLLESSQAPQN